MGGIASALIAPLVMTIFHAFARTPPPARPPQHVQELRVDEREQLIRKAKDKLGMNSNVFNFGITGQSRTGKSTLINSLRLIADENCPEAAKVGEIETTMKPTMYPHPSLSHFVLWDIPGAGTASHPIATYFDDKCLLAFDCLLVVCE